MHKSDKIHAHTIMMHSVQALYCNWDCHWDCLRILGVYKYVFKQGTYGVIEVSENAITVNGYPYCKLQKFTLIRTEPIGEKYSKQDTETENYKGVFSCKSNGRSITLSNSDYMFEAALDGNECRLTELSPEHKNIGTLEKQWTESTHIVKQSLLWMNWKKPHSMLSTKMVVIIVEIG